MKYRRDQPLGANLHEGEPFFLLRAQDIVSTYALAYYAITLRKLGLNDMAREIDAIGVQFVEWQAEHADETKLPD